MQDKIEQLNKIKAMLDNGFINEAEFNSLKRGILGDIKSNNLLPNEQTSGNDIPNKTEKNKPINNQFEGDLAKDEKLKELHENEYSLNFKKSSKRKRRFLFTALTVGAIILLLLLSELL